VDKTYEENDKVQGYGAPELIHGLWYRYCEKCDIYHALISNAQLAERFFVSPVTKNVRGNRIGRGRGKLMLVQLTISGFEDVS
jgi:hypothetical protein